MRGAGTRFATCFFAIHRFLRQKQALYATVHSSAFQTLAHNARVALAVKNIENSQFWRALYRLMSAVFPALCAMRYCDANVPVMDKIYYLVKRVDYALLSSQPILNDERLFGPMYGALCEGVSFLLVFYFHWFITLSIDSFVQKDVILLGQVIQDSWAKKKSLLEHEYALTGWSLSVLPEIHANVLSVLTGENHLMIKKVGCMFPLAPMTKFQDWT